MHAFAIEWVRSQFPSLELSVDGRPAIFLDAPGVLMRSILRHIAVSMCKHWDAIFWFAQPINSLGLISVRSGENTDGWTNWRRTKCDLPQQSPRKNGKRGPKASRASQELRVLSIISRKPDTRRTEAVELVERWK